MKLLELTEYLIKEIVNDKASVSVTEHENDEYIILEVSIANEDIGRVIGKNGMIANAIRTIVSSSAYLHYKKKVRININEK